MEAFEARIERLEYSPADIFLLEIVVSPLPVDAPGRGKPEHYTMELDPGAPSGPSMKPGGELQNCFNVHHRYEYDNNLDVILDLVEI